MVYDTAADIATIVDEFDHGDGRGKSITFVRLEDFLNWYNVLVCVEFIVFCRYDIDPTLLGALPPTHQLCQEHRLMEIRAHILMDLGRMNANT